MLPQYIQNLWIFRRVRRLYFQHFALILFVFIVTFLCIGLIAFENFFWISSVISFTLSISAALYYLLYFSKFQNLVDFYTRKEYYFDIFSFWSIIFFNILFICCLALLGIVIDTLSKGSLFESASYKEATLLVFQAVVDGGTFGLLDAFGIDFCKLQSNTCDIRPGTPASIYTYAVSLTVDVAFWASITAELVGWIEARHEVSNLLRIDKLEPETLSPEEIKRNQIILKRISEGKIDITQHEGKLVTVLKDSKLKEVRSVFLFIMQSTKSMMIFKACLEYFKKTGDGRFKIVCEKIKHYEKRKLIEEFEFRQVRIKPWRGRGKKPNT